MFINRTTRLLLRRKYRRSKRQVEGIGDQAEEQLERHFLRRLGRLLEVRRFLASWMLLLILLSGVVVMQARTLSSYYQELTPVPGGIYVEGIIGSFTNANPIYAVDNVDKSVSDLLFGSLLKYDKENRLVGDLAKDWKIDETGKRYTVSLRDNLYWHDGEELTAEDVVYTYKLIQNPDAKSPLFSSWFNVKVSAVDERTVVFELPNSLTSFPHSLTNGLVPKHKLQDIPIPQLRSSGFNTQQPIGSGPFKWSAVEVDGTTPETREERIGLTPNDGYYAGKPHIQRYIIRAFREEEQMIKSFENRELNAMVGLNSMPDNLRLEASVRSYSIPITGSVMVFLKTTDTVMSDAPLRRALVQSVDTKELIKGLDYPAIKVDSPLLSSHVGYNPKIVQHKTNKEAAKKALDKLGWKIGPDGIREKKGQRLEFSLHAQNTSEFSYVAQFLQREWREAGVDVKVDQPSESDFQSIVSFHNYTALLHGISLGPGPDVFAYWHSSQADVRADNRLNFSEYSSEVADQALEGGRTRADSKLRVAKYKPFLETWRNDAPALALYQPRFLYVVRGGLYHFEPKVVNFAADRLNNVHEWMIRQDRVSKQ